MVQLFYGTFVTERRHKGMLIMDCFLSYKFTLKPFYLALGKTLYNIEQFGQYPLQVNGFNNLDECLEGAMVEKEIESLHADHSVMSAREVTSSEQLKKKRMCKI